MVFAFQERMALRIEKEKLKKLDHPRIRIDHICEPLNKDDYYLVTDIDLWCDGNEVEAAQVENLTRKMNFLYKKIIKENG